MSSPPAIPSSTILMVRPTDTAFEVLIVERHYQIDFASGALVFPGGKLSHEDRDPAWIDHVDGVFDAEERAYRIGAVREAFEESGLMLARRRGQTSIIDAAANAPLQAHRDAVASGGGFLDLVRTHDLVLALDLLTPFAHWVTPKGMPKRFDTRFYVAMAPEGQTAVCDGGEAVDACWIEPGAALTAAADGRRKIIFPTRMNLELLSRAATAENAMNQAAMRTIVCVEPQIVKEEGGLVLTIPAEAGYSVTREPLDSAL